MSGTIIRRADFGADGGLVPQIEAIFFAGAATDRFASETERDAFRERWLGRYLRHFPDDVWLAIGAPGEVFGYLTGCRDSDAAAPLFADIGYYPRLAGLFGDYPAHLHINMRADRRGAGHGRALLAAFAEDCRRSGVPGIHVVTAADARAVGFYRRCGFAPVMEMSWTGRKLVALGLLLDSD